MKITVNGRFASNNEFLAANRTINGKWNKGNAMKKQDEQVIVWQLKAQHIPKLRPPITLDYTFYEPNRKRDLDNVAAYFIKVFQDALIKIGALENDGWSEIAGYSVKAEKGRKARVEIEITERRQNESS